tara:strand:+ start:930 stop:1103 length:174 start_codon:yes stop_codon:yes gene_type:complete
MATRHALRDTESEVVIWTVKQILLEDINRDRSLEEWSDYDEIGYPWEYIGIIKPHKT